MGAQESSHVKKLVALAREHLSNAVVGGLVLVLTGFTPEHWFANALHAIHVAPQTLRWLSLGLDPRLLLVLFGIAVIVGDQLLRQRASVPPASGVSAVQGFTASSQSPLLAETQNPAPALALPQGPSIAVLPFSNIGGDPKQDYFADGMVEDIIGGLCRVKWLFVIARSSSFTYKGVNVDVKKVGLELGVRYVLEGSVRKVANSLRISAQLVEAESGRHIWAERYDCKLDDIFALQDQITLSIVAAIEPSLRLAEVDRIKRKRTDSLDAYDLVLRAQPDVYARMPENAVKALPLLRRALTLDPNYALAHAYAAECHHTIFLRGGLREEERTASIHHAEAAIACGQDDALALTFAGFVIGLDKHDRAAAFAAFEAALAVSPSTALAYILGSIVLAFAGEAERAIEWGERALRMSPFDPWRSTAFSALSLGHFSRGRYQEAAAAARKAIQFSPGFNLSYLELAAPLVKMGQLDEAKVAAARVLELQPDFRLSRFFAGAGFAPTLAASLSDAIRQVGLPD